MLNVEFFPHGSHGSHGFIFRCKQRVFSSGLNGKTPKESKIREIREIRVEKFNI